MYKLRGICIFMSCVAYGTLVQFGMLMFTVNKELIIVNEKPLIMKSHSHWKLVIFFNQFFKGDPGIHVN